jgi:hypothetical protein
MNRGLSRSQPHLGAGLDSFAYRHPEPADRVTTFEVDHPLLQALADKTGLTGGLSRALAIPRRLLYDRAGVLAGLAAAIRHGRACRLVLR